MNKSKRKAIIAGNWKMNKTAAEAEILTKEITAVAAGADCEVIICPPFTAVSSVVTAVAGSNVAVGVQNVHYDQSGAYTGEISAEMAREIGASFAIIGHSERREYFGETNETVNLRLKAAIKSGLTAILCVGETKELRELGVTQEVIAMQTKIALGEVNAEDMKSVIIAYEPVWAIGTGLTATVEQAQEVCKNIREIIKELYNTDVAEALTIQYGGSMNAKNAASLLDMPDIDGGLIGGAALKPDDFAEIIKAASR